jgi:glycyl-tRNA synthetase
MSVPFQELIVRLQQFWSQKGGCLLWQPYSEKVGAGTMNPATVLQVVGPEPWNVAYVEPSYRPDDGRFGENPNRMQMHTQYQVILKPDPGNPQELYLESLRACGIDTDAHDIRFVEDNWESPALGAWGLGWEVWLDGLEITQFTYFQQSAGQVLEMPAVEITYGLERIAMFIQGVRKVWDLDWDGRYTYGEVLLQPEIDHCKYDFEVADVERLKELYKLYEAEAKSCLAAGLVVPAHDYILRCSHTFNVLDAQGAVGVTERAGYFAKMRDMSRAAADNYLAQREKLGFPLLKKSLNRTPAQAEQETQKLPSMGSTPTAPADFVFEVGTEELPSHEVVTAVEQLKSNLVDLLSKNRLEHGDVETYCTPRRLTVLVRDLASKQLDREVEIKGPPANVAMGEDGKPTQAGIGFCKAQGIDPETLRVETDGKRTYVAATKKETGRTAGEVLRGELGGIISGLRFGRTMRWNDSKVSFSRPVRWVVALHDSAIVSFEFAGFSSGRTSRGLRPLGSPALRIPSAGDYLKVMADNSIMVDRAARQAAIVAQLEQVAAAAGGRVPEGQEALLEEVTDLVEAPFAALGRFEETHLSLPSSVLVTVMKKHQRYFPVEKSDGSGELLPHFVVVCNGERSDMKLVVQGYEDVLRARYADAAYFVLADRKKKLADYREALASLTFQTELGSMLDKQVRLEQLVADLAKELQVSDQDTSIALKATALAKNDLVTSMVVEMTSLQGVLGEVYALDSGEDPAVAQAIREHYLPKAAGGTQPQTLPGALLGVADRLDSLVGLFAVGKKPTGSADPFGLRRHALTLVDLLVSRKLSVSLDRLFALAAAHLPVQVSQSHLDDLLAFARDRMVIWFKEQGHRHDLVEAAVFGGSPDPYRISEVIEALSNEVQSETWDSLLNAYARCCRIVKGFSGNGAIDSGRFSEEPTKALLARYTEVSADLPLSDVSALVEALSVLQPAIDEFFDKVLVMADDEALKNARLNLLAHIARLPQGLVDLSRVEGF